MKTQIVLISDFGTDDPYIGIMKGMINSINHDVSIIDLSHSIPKYNVESASYILETSEEYFSQYSIFLSVVDPGVGSERKCLFVISNNKLYIAPDNGILSFLNNRIINIYEINKNYHFHNLPKSNTFHGRDIFAPTAALISKYLFENTIKLENTKLSFENLDYIKLIDKNETFTFNNKLVENSKDYKIVWIDSFGNCISNIRFEDINSHKIQIKDEIFENVNKQYIDVKINENIIYFGSSNFIEFAVNQGNFAKKYNIEVGQKIKLVKKTGT